MSAHSKIYLHPVIERLWHWVHAACICGLAITGIGIHWPVTMTFLGGLDTAVTLHNIIAWITIGDFTLWILLNVVLKRFFHYVPNRSDFGSRLIRQLLFYGMYNFLGGENPAHPTPAGKFNPMQKFSYLAVMGILMPVVMVTGILYLYPIAFAGVIDALGGLTVIAIVHFVIAGCLCAFMVVHVYLCSLGPSVIEDYQHMITGYGSAPHGEQHDH